MIGICGSEQKARFLCDEMSFDAAICYRDGSVAQRLTEHCPDGVDVYFDNVGGEISDAVVATVYEGKTT